MPPSDCLLLCHKGVSISLSSHVFEKRVLDSNRRPSDTVVSAALTN